MILGCHRDCVKGVTVSSCAREDTAHGLSLPPTKRSLLSAGNRFLLAARVSRNLEPRCACRTQHPTEHRSTSLCKSVESLIRLIVSNDNRISRERIGELGLIAEIRTTILPFEGKFENSEIYRGYKLSLAAARLSRLIVRIPRDVSCKLAWNNNESFKPRHASIRL